MQELRSRLKKGARKIKADLQALRIALAENLVPWYVKALIILTVGYALSPVDLIPDIIPVLGLLDDIIIVPFLIYITIKLIPKPTMQYCRDQARVRGLNKETNWVAGSIIILLWLAFAFWFIINFTRYIGKQ